MFFETLPFIGLANKFVEYLAVFIKLFEKKADSTGVCAHIDNL